MSARDFLRRRTIVVVAIATLAMFAVDACSGAPPTASDPAAGTERGACFPNGTCDTGLKCLSDRCVNVGTVGADSTNDGAIDASDAPSDAPLEDGSGRKSDASVDARVTMEGGWLACPTTVNPADIPVYRSTQPGPGSCTPSDIAAIVVAVENATKTFVDVYNGIANVTCRSCVFANETDAHWAPITWQPDMASGMAFVDGGACYEVASGSQACGKAVQDRDYCVYRLACDPACEPDVCEKLADMGTCKTQNDAVTAACGAALPSLGAKCFTFEDLVDVVCGQGPSDASSD